MRTVRLGSISSMKYGKLPPKEVLDSGYPIFTGYRVSGYSKEYLYRDAMLIVVARGVGGTGDVKIAPEKAWITNLSIVLDLDSSKIDKYFLYYRLGQEALKDKLNTGSAQAQITIEALSQYEISVPDLASQHQIATILGAYDALIATNHRRIALLEDAARRLYREWFVHLRFPGHESVPVKDGVPEGWTVRNLFDVCDVDYGFPFKANQFNTDGIGMPAIRIRDIPDVSTLTYTSEEVDRSYIVNRGDFLIGMDGIFHMNFWVGENALLVQRVCRIRPKTELLRAYVGLALHAPIKAFEATIQGATVAHLGAKHLKSIDLLIPAEMDEQLEYLNQILWQQIHLREVNRKLAQARDLLLPKLMSGQLDVSGIALPDEVAA